MSQDRDGPSAELPDHFDRLYWLVDQAMPHVSPRELKVLLIVERHADFATGDARPPVERIARMVGTTPRHVYEALAKLESLGFLKTTDSGGGRGRSATRRLLAPSGYAKGNPARSGPETLPAAGMESVENPARSGAKTLPVVAQNPARSGPETLPAAGSPTYQTDQRTYQQQQQQSVAAAAAAPGGGTGEEESGSSLVAVLRAIGISPPALDELASLPVSPAVVVNIFLDLCRRQRIENPIGVLITTLRGGRGCAREVNAAHLQSLATLNLIESIDGHSVVEVEATNDAARVVTTNGEIYLAPHEVGTANVVIGVDRLASLASKSGADRRRLLGCANGTARPINTNREAARVGA